MDVYKCDKKLQASGSKSWIGSAIQLENKFNIDTDNTDMKLIKTEINNNSNQSVLNHLQYLRNSSEDKLNFFSNVYHTFQLQPYLKIGLDKSITKHLTALRISSHTLRIERGRYTRPKTPRPERLCLVCNSVEDEVHFLLHCKKATNRKLILNSVDLEINNIQCDEQTIIKEICNPYDNPKTENICRFIATNMT